MKCVRCGDETQGTYNEGGILTAICDNCDYEEQKLKELDRKDTPYVRNNKLNLSIPIVDNLDDIDEEDWDYEND